MNDVIRVAQIMGKMENGGVESVVMNYYRHIDKNKVQFDFIVDNDSSCPQEKEIVALGGRVIKIAPYQNIINNLRDLEKIFKENQYKIVHSHLTTMSVFSLAVAKKCGIPVRICHAHSTAAKGEGVKNAMKYMLRPFAKVFATDYFACSDHAGKWLYGKNIGKSKRYKVIPNAIDVEKFSFHPSIRDEVRRELGLEDKFVVGHIGRFVYQKNHDFLIDIFYEVHRKNPNSVLILVGDGELIGNVKKKVQRLGLDPYVKFLGVRNDTDRLYQAFDVFVLPSRYEGLPVVGIEAQVAGLPCILSDTITREVNFTGDIRYISLKKHPKTWAIMCLQCSNRNSNLVDSFKCNRFNINFQADRLRKIYIEMGKES